MQLKRITFVSALKINIFTVFIARFSLPQLGSLFYKKYPTKRLPFSIQNLHNVKLIKNTRKIFVSMYYTHTVHEYVEGVTEITVFKQILYIFRRTTGNY